MTDDDDLPILTDILRLGDPSAAKAAPPTAVASAIRPAPVVAESDADPELLDEPLLADALVVGAGPAPRLGDGLDEYLATPRTWDDAGPPSKISASMAADLAAPPITGTGAPGQAHETASTGDRDALDPRRSFRLDEPPLLGSPMAGADATESTLPVRVASLPDPAAPETIDKTPSRPLSDADRASIAERVRETVLNDVAMRVDVELDARIAQALHAEIETALGGLQARLREQLADALRDVVGRAVDDALAARVLERPDRRPDRLH